MRIFGLLLTISGVAQLAASTVAPSLDLDPRAPPVRPWDGKPKWEDVGQGNSKSCALTAAIKIVVYKDLDYTERMLDYDSATSTVTVRLPADPRDPATFPAQEESVKYSSVARRKQLPFYGRGTAWWPAAVMKALEVRRGVNCNTVVHINRALELVYGRLVHRIDRPEDGFSEQSLHAFFERMETSESPALISTPNAPELFTKGGFLVPNHAYGVVEYDSDNRIVTLMNPWQRGRGLAPQTSDIPIAMLLGQRVEFLAQPGVSHVPRDEP